MLTDFMLQNTQFFMGLIATLLVWVAYKIWTVKIDKNKVLNVLALILDIIQDIKNGDDTGKLPNAEKKALAVDLVEKTIAPKKKKWIQKVFGSIGGAVEFVYHNRKSLFTAAAALLKRSFKE